MRNRRLPRRPRLQPNPRRSFPEWQLDRAPGSSGAHLRSLSYCHYLLQAIILLALVLLVVVKQFPLGTWTAAARGHFVGPVGGAGVEPLVGKHSPLATQGGEGETAHSWVDERWGVEYGAEPEKTVGEESDGITRPEGCSRTQTCYVVHYFPLRAPSHTPIPSIVSTEGPEDVLTEVALG